jgi:hypothetical protein
MERYLAQLMEDLQQAKLKFKPTIPLWKEGDPEDDLESVDFSQVEKYENNEVTPISEITGIHQEQLPPVEKLNQEQQAFLAAGLEDLLQHFHFELDFPRDYPRHFRYAFIRKLWSEEQVAVTFGEIHIEFCDYDEENCPFPGYCNSCQEASEYVKNYNEQGGIDNTENGKNGPYPFDIYDDDDDNPVMIDINELNDAHGNKIDLASIPIPSLCLICNKYRMDDWDENLLCLMNRNDQSGQPNFMCDAFEKI